MPRTELRCIRLSDSVAVSDRGALLPSQPKCTSEHPAEQLSACRRLGGEEFRHCLPSVGNGSNTCVDGGCDGAKGWGTEAASNRASRPVLAAVSPARLKAATIVQAGA